MQKRRIGLTGIEPALLSKLDPKSSASASSATAPFNRLEFQAIHHFQLVRVSNPELSFRQVHRLEACATCQSHRLEAYATSWRRLVRPKP